MRGATEQVFLVVRAPNGETREFPVSEAGTVIGRDETADIRVDDNKVSRRHASFRLIDGQLWAEDLGSVNGIRLNGRKVQGRVKLNAQDVVLVGAYAVSLRDAAPVQAKARPEPVADGTAPMRAAPPERSGKVASRIVLVGQGRPVAGRRFALSLGRSGVGRHEKSEVSIVDGSVSRHHARIELSADRAKVTDLGSSNGTFVNGIRVDAADLKSSDRLRFGSVEFRVELSSDIPGRVGPVEPSKHAGVEEPAPRSSRHLVLGGVALLLSLVSLYVVVVHRDDLKALWQSRLSGGAGEQVIEGPDGPEAPATGPGVPVVVRTATSPFGPKAPEGLPANLPAIDVGFDFDEFVAQKLAEATALKDGASRLALASVLKELLARDPINTDALQMQKQLELDGRAEALLAEGDRLRSEGRLLEALQVYARVPSEATAVEQAKLRRAQLLPIAIKRELERAEREAEKSKGWLRAHQRLATILQLDPEAAQAKAMVVEVEKKMLAAGVSFTALLEVPEEPGGSKDDPARQIAARYGERGLERVVEVYVKGNLTDAIKRADAVIKRAKAKDKGQAKAVAGVLRRLETKYQRVRAEVANDPAQAWAQLMEFRKVEREILPEGVDSYLATELGQTIATAYAERGEGMLEQGRLESAFQALDSGYQLNPRNPRILAGLKKLEEKANTFVKEAELAAQRGAADACERWRRITRMTRSEAEAHKRARERLQRGC